MRLRRTRFVGAAVILSLIGAAEQAYSGNGPFRQPVGWTRPAAPRVEAVQDTARNGGDGAEGAVADTVGRVPADSALYLGLRRLRLPYPIDLASRLPDLERQRPEFRSRLQDWTQLWVDSVSRVLRDRRGELWRRAVPVAGTGHPGARLATADSIGPRGAGPEAGGRQQPVDTAVAAADTAPAVPIRPDQPDLLPDALSQYADLGIAVQGRVELGGGWNRFRPCDVNIRLNCSPGLVPDIKPDIQFGARVGGTISDRVHVNVDYDNRREFDAANNINVYYQGLEDEILQRVEVGDVSLQLPNSRYLTRGIPAGNFGFRATGQMGPIDFQTVWAQQKGDLRTQELELGGGGRGLEQQSTTILDDADYETGRFFFLFDPARLSSYPHIDIQRLVATDAPPAVQPASAIKLYRYEAFTFGINNQIPEGFVTARAVAADTFRTAAGADTVVVDTLRGLFRPLVEGEDYTIHRSGLWIQLRNTLNAQEGLAVTYRASDGTEIGTFNVEAVSDAHTADPDAVPPPVLELLKGVNHRPNTATWDREMHHVYRVSASPGVVRPSIELTISQGDPELGNTFRTGPDGRQLEFLKIFGLDDDPTDNELDDAQIYESQADGFVEGTSGPVGTYIVFPTLEPFRTPPPLRDVTGSLAGQPFPLDPGDQNPTIYDEPIDQVREGANLYLLTIRYRQRFEGFVSTINLGTGGVREGSERLVIDNTELVRGEDYTVDYDVGQIELQEPDRWFRNNPDARIRVAFEQKPLFELAPTTVFGLQARYGLGTAGELNIIGLSQTEKTLQTRPELGLEPSAVQLGGVSGRLDFRPDWLTRLVDALPLVDTEGPSSISLDGELAVSMPTTNTQGVTYIEDFEGGPGNIVGMTSRSWDLGSAPSTGVGAEGILPTALVAGNAAELTWQDQYIIETSDGPQIVGGLRPDQIDEELKIQGTPRPEPVLFMTLRQPENRTIAPTPTPPIGPAWRSITHVISPNGQDFTAIEFLELYVAVPDDRADSVSLILDLGTISEDAFGLDSLGLESGIGRLNREVEPPRIWSTSDDVGLWSSGCIGERGVRAFPLGDIRANCTRGNGLEDSEDINQNGNLDTEERFFRYTIRVGDPGNRYFVREARSFGDSRFRLYRIPLRRPDHRERAGDAEFQNIRHLRVTAVSDADAQLVLARMRFIGSRWLKRGRAGVVSGLTDTTSAVSPGAAVDVGPISTLDSRYEPPPGITDQVANQADQFTIGGTTAFNEQSLRIAFSDLGPDERAEVFLQYAQTPRDFLSYRSLRAWALGASGPWGENGEPLRFFVKFGENARNFYLYRTPLGAVPPDAQGPALRQAWRPERQIDFDRFIALRAKAEELLLTGGGLSTDSTLEVWDVDVFEDGDSSYAVVISQRSRAPNLAAVRQISLGVHNGGAAPVAAGEVWVDDMRLGTAVDNMGLVSELNLNVVASDVLSLNARYSTSNPYFRQLGDDPTFQSSKQLDIGGRFQFGHFLPDSWGIDMPLNVTYANSGSDPLLLPRTDIPGERLPGLRTPMSRDLRADVRLDKRTRTEAGWARWFVDNSSLRFGINRGNRRNSRSTTDLSGLSAGYSYRSEVGDVSFPLFPGFLDDLFFFLPNAITDSRFRLTPRTVTLNTGYTNTELLTRRFDEIIRLPGDTAAEAIRNFDERLQSNATVQLEPLTALTGQVNFAQDRELVAPRELVRGRASRRLLRRERTSIAGLDLGWETARSLNMNFAYRPGIAPWLQPRASVDTRFRFNRNASYVTVLDGDTVLTRDFNNSRTLNTSVAFNLPQLLRTRLAGERGGMLRVLLGLVDRLDVFTASWSRSLSSLYQRERASPGLGYQLGLGGFDAFRVQQRDTASRVNQNEALTLSSGVQLPLTVSVNVDYSQNDATVWTPNSQFEGHNVTWPNVRVNWSRVPLPAFTGPWVRSLGLRTGYTFRTREDVIVGANQVRRSENRSIPVSVNLALTTGWSFGYNLNLEKGERTDPTGVTRTDDTNHSFQVTARFQAPGGGATLRSPIRASLRYTQSDRAECRQLGGVLAGEGGVGLDRTCEPFTDLRTQRVELTVDTDISPFVIGLQGSWRNQQSNLGEEPGSTQLEISLFGQFLFQTGVIR